VGNGLQTRMCEERTYVESLGWKRIAVEVVNGVDLFEKQGRKMAITMNGRHLP